jgi:hypothetical protein
MFGIESRKRNHREYFAGGWFHYDNDAALRFELSDAFGQGFSGDTLYLGIQSEDNMATV